MDKFFENMDKRFNSIENELDYDYSDYSWLSAEKMLDDAFLDNTFIEAEKSSIPTPIINFESIDDAFLDDAFIEAISSTKANYTSQYFKDFKIKEEALFENETFVNAANSTKTNYESAYWNAASIALQSEGLHYEYKTEYWTEAEKLLIKDKQNRFFWLWSSIATILILFSAIGLNYNAYTYSNDIVSTPQNEEPFKRDQNKSANQTNTETVQSLPNKINKSDFKTQQFNQSSLNIIEPNTGTKFNELNSTTNKLNQNNNSNSSVPNKNTLLKTPVIHNHTNQHSNIKKSTQQINTKLTIDELIPTIISKIRVPKIGLITTDKIKVPTPLLKITSIITKPTHEIGLKLEKGIGNVFTNNKTTFSARNALYLDYRFSPVKKLRQFEFGIETGLYHMNLDNLEYQENYSVHKDYGGVDHYWFKITYKDLIYISSSINAFYKINNGHKIKASVGIDKLITSKIDIEYQSDIGNIVYNDNIGEWGINKGISSLDLTIGIGYEYEFNTKLSFLIDSKFGTVDKTNNNYLRNKKMNRDFSILFGIKYNIFTTR